MRALKDRSWLVGNGRAASVALVLLLFALTGLVQPASASDTVTLGQTNLGNIFTDGKETVQVPLTTTGTQVSWTCTDFYGAVTNGGPIAVTNGAAVIQPNLGRLGYFALHVTALTNGNAVATADTTFAVVAPVTVSTMGDSPFGVCTHFAEGWSPVVTPLIAKGGMALFRDEQYWSTVETRLGQYDFSAFTPYMTAAASAGLSPLAELDFSNSLYDGGYTPYEDMGNTGYANYAVALLNQYDSASAPATLPKVPAVEIWNEYNGSYYSQAPPTPTPTPTPTPGTSPTPSPTPTPTPVPSPYPSRAVQYTAMIKKAYPAIKAAQPNVTVVGGACVPLPIPWFQDLFSAGALPYMDAVDIHPYVDPPEVLDAPLASLQSLMAANNNGVAKPIWVTECGYTDVYNPGRQLMASYLVRLMTVMRADGVAKAFWYLLYDADSSTSGLIRPPTDPLGPYVPTSGYPAYANLIQQLYGATFVQRETTDSRTRFYLFKRGAANTPVHVLWSTMGTTQLVLTASAPLTLVNIMGETTTLTPNASGQVTVAADINPVYVVGAVSSLHEVGRDQILADSIRDFGSTQGTGNNAWSYLYYLGGGSTPATCTYYNPYNFGKMNWTRTSAEYCWVTPNGFTYPLVDATGAHPGTYTFDNKTYYQFQAVRRYTSAVAGTAHIVGYASLNNTAFSDGAGASIYVDGKLIARNALAALSSVNFDYSVPVAVGSNIDFVADPGPGTDYNYDYLLFRAQISVPLPTTFSAWQNEYFTSAQIANPAVSGDAASPAGDGVPNLLKYAANLNPMLPTTSAFPVVGTTTSGGMKYLTLSSRQATAATDLVYKLEVNTGALGTPSAWTTLVTTPTSVDNGDGTQTVTYQDTTPIGGTPRFLRLRVTRSQ